MSEIKVKRHVRELIIETDKILHLIVRFMDFQKSNTIRLIKKNKFIIKAKLIA